MVYIIAGFSDTELDGQGRPVPLRSPSLLAIVPLAAVAKVCAAPATKPDRSRSTIAANATLNAVIPAVAARSLRLRRL